MPIIGANIIPWEGPNFKKIDSYLGVMHWCVDKARLWLFSVVCKTGAECFIYDASGFTDVVFLLQNKPFLIF